MTTTYPRAAGARPVHDGITVRWHDAATGADRALQIHVALRLGVEPESVQVGRLCGRCGSAAHGRPWASHGVHVSLARSGPHLVTAVSTAGPVGVDVEGVADVDRAWDDLSTLLDAGVDVHGSGRAALWCRTEAVLKRHGTGLSARPDRALMAHEVVDDLVAPAGYCAAVAVAGP
jgi:4'-phosphopantetheinyl transferase